MLRGRKGDGFGSPSIFRLLIHGERMLRLPDRAMMHCLAWRSAEGSSQEWRIPGYATASIRQAPGLGLEAHVTTRTLELIIVNHDIQSSYFIQEKCSNKQNKPLNKALLAFARYKGSRLFLQSCDYRIHVAERRVHANILVITLSLIGHCHIRLTRCLSVKGQPRKTKRIA